MRYLVKAKVKPGQEKALLEAIESGRLGQGSVAGDEYLDDMQKARITEDGVCAWVEVCFCATPLQEERPYWEEYLTKGQMLHPVVKVLRVAGFGNDFQIIDALAYRHAQLMGINDAGKESPRPLARGRLGEQVFVSGKQHPV